MHVCRLYLVPLPQITPSAKFWSLFAPLAERNEGSRITFGSEGEGTSSDEAVLQIVKRNQPKAGMKRFITKTLVGWKDRKTCDLASLEALRGLVIKTADSQVSIYYSPAYVAHVSFSPQRILQTHSLFV